MDLLVSFLVVGLIGASLIVWARAAAKWRRGLPLVAFEPRRPAPWTAADLCVIAIVYVLTNVGFYVGLDRIAAAAEEQQGPSKIAVALMATSLGNLSTAGLAIFWIRLRTGATWADLGFRFDKAVSDLRLGLLTFAGVSAPVYLLQALLSQLVEEKHPIIEMLQRHREPWVLALSAISAVVIAPIAEEFFFRGLLQGWCQSLFGEGPAAGGGSSQGAGEPADTTPPAGPADPGNPYSPSPSLARSAHGEAAVGWFNPEADASGSPAPGSRSVGGLRWDYAPIVLSSLVFSLMHVGHGADPIPLFFLALALGYLYQRTGRLLPSVVVHFCLNACSMLALCFGVAAGAK